VILSCAQDQYTGPVLSVIIYTDEIYQKSALPLFIESATGNSTISGNFKEIVLSNMTEAQLLEIDPKLVILAPFTIESNIPKPELAMKCNQWQTTALSVYKDKLKRNVLNVMSLFILNRFKDLTVKEVRTMLNFDLSDTRAGEELLNIGRQEGRQELLYTQLCNRFGTSLPVPKEMLFSADTDVINRKKKGDVYDFMLFFESFNILPIKA
jgi:hypothetical protein